MMKNCLEVLGDRRCCIAREMTKIHEEFLRGTISELMEELDGLKGEMVVVIDGSHEDFTKDIDMGTVMKMVNESVERGMSRSEAIKNISRTTGIPKNRIYDYVHKADLKGQC
jgi:16S rRNA (cytidine1402-2'-O)-methyltransferase